MIKKEFLDSLKSPLSQLGYRKHGQYWYKEQNDILYCINVQGSQWDKDDYYVEIGIAQREGNTNYPTLLHWNTRHRCVGQDGDLNISIEDLLWCISNILEQIENTAQIESFLFNHSAVKVGVQYWF